jgi:hypothetical protein
VDDIARAMTNKGENLELGTWNRTTSYRSAGADRARKEQKTCKLTQSASFPLWIGVAAVRASMMGAITASWSYK